MEQEYRDAMAVWNELTRDKVNLEVADLLRSGDSSVHKYIGPAKGSFLRYLKDFAFSDSVEEAVKMAKSSIKNLSATNVGKTYARQAVRGYSDGMRYDRIGMLFLKAAPFGSEAWFVDMARCYELCLRIE